MILPVHGSRPRQSNTFCRSSSVSTSRRISRARAEICSGFCPTVSMSTTSVAGCPISLLLTSSLLAARTSQGFDMAQLTFDIVGKGSGGTIGAYRNSVQGGNPMNSLILVLMMMQLPTTQFLVSTKAGLVNYVKGSATVRAATSVPAGKVVQTGPNGNIEILLNPGSYLRMGENTQVVLENVDLENIVVRILSGSAIIEASGIDKDLPMTVLTGDLKMEIVKDGIYRFADGKVIVVDGKIRDAANGLIYGKGYQVSNDQGYRAQKVKTFTTELERWSQSRDEQIAQANFNVAKSIRQTQGLPIGSFFNVWVWSTAFNGFVYMPGDRYRSPYGYRYETAGNVPSYGGYSGDSGGGFGSNASNN